MNKKRIIFLVIFVFMLITLFIFKDDIIFKTSKSIDNSLKEEYSGETININESGTYNLSGEKIGNIIINASGNVELVLDNLNMKSLNGPVILIEDASEVIISLKDGTKNILEDTSNYNIENIDSVIYSKSDLIIDGMGSLEIKANYKNGIVSKDDLEIKNGNFKIVAKNEGIKGKDLVHILNGEFDINSYGDSIKSNNDKDLEKGNVIIENGKFILESGLDAIQAEKDLIIKNGEFSISTFGNIRKKDISSKGLKANNKILIENGSFNLKTTDDSINTNNYLEIQNGNFVIETEDDAIKSDNEILIDTGEFNITRCEEGLESAKITINNGNFNIISFDDGINVKEEKNRGLLIINNGNFKIDSGDDGIDINGNGYMYNGNIIIDSFNSINTSSIDFEDEFLIEKGEIIALGSNDMLEYIESTKQYNVIINLEEEYPKNTKISITDLYDKEIVSYTSLKEFEAFTVSSSKLKNKNTYKIKINDQDFDKFIVDGNTTLVRIKVKKFYKKLIILR